MAVISIQEIPQKDGQNNGPHDQSVTRTFRVITNDPFDTSLTIEPAMPIQWGSALGSTGLICQGISYDLMHKGPGRSVWTVAYTFQTQVIDQEEVERQEFPNPLDRRARISVRSVRYGVLTIRDKDGNVKRTSAGEIYEPKEKDATRWTIHVRKNYISIPDFIWDYQDKLNAAEVTVKGRVLDAETVKFGEVFVPELQIENGVEFYPIEFDLDYRRDGWDDSRVDAGFYYLDDGELKPILDAEGDPVVVEEWLDGDGGRLRESIANPQPGDEKFNIFEDYETADFSVLPLNEG